MTNQFATEQFESTAKVLVTTNFYKADSDGQPRFDDNTGARFWSRAYGDGCIGIVVNIDKAQNIVKNGHDITDAIISNRATVRLSRDDFELLSDTTSEMSGIGTKFVIELEKEPHISRLEIKNSANGNNGVQTAVTLWGAIVSEPTPATSTLSEVGVDTSNHDDVVAALMEGKAQVAAQRERALGQNRAAREGMATSAAV